MTKEEIIEGNTAIAIFMGAKLKTYNLSNLPYYQMKDKSQWMPERLIYHSSWDWIHGAWEKFRVLEFKGNPDERYGLKEQFESHFKAISYALVNYEIIIVHARFVRAIHWFNTTQTPKP